MVFAFPFSGAMKRSFIVHPPPIYPHCRIGYFIEATFKRPNPIRCLTTMNTLNVGLPYKVKPIPNTPFPYPIPTPVQMEL